MISDSFHLEGNIYAAIIAYRLWTWKLPWHGGHIDKTHDEIFILASQILQESSHG